MNNMKIAIDTDKNKADIHSGMIWARGNSIVSTLSTIIDLYSPIVFFDAFHIEILSSFSPNFSRIFLKIV